VVPAFVSSRLDYCNSLLFGISDNLLRRIQAVQNAAARLVTVYTTSWAHYARLEATSLAASVTAHWIQAGSCGCDEWPGMALIFYSSLQYLADDYQLTSTAGRRRLWSSNVATCEVPRTHTSLGDRSFTVAGPRLWINLPLHLRDSEHTLLEFRRLLKTHLFCWWGQRRLVTVCYFCSS